MLVKKKSFKMVISFERNLIYRYPFSFFFLWFLCNICVVGKVLPVIGFLWWQDLLVSYKLVLVKDRKGSQTYLSFALQGFPTKFISRKLCQEKPASYWGMKKLKNFIELFVTINFSLEFFTICFPFFAFYKFLFFAIRRMLLFYNLVVFLVWLYSRTTAFCSLKIGEKWEKGCLDCFFQFKFDF